MSTRTEPSGTMRLRRVAAIALQRGGALAATAARALAGVGVEPHLQLRLRPHDRADVAALGDGVAAGQERALRLVQRLAHRGLRGHVRHRVVDLVAAQRRVVHVRAPGARRARSATGSAPVRSASSVTARYIAPVSSRR